MVLSYYNFADIYTFKTPKLLEQCIQLKAFYLKQFQSATLFSLYVYLTNNFRHAIFNNVATFYKIIFKKIVHVPISLKAHFIFEFISNN